MPTTTPPSSLDGIKRFAKAIKAKERITHREALEAAAKLAGYQSYTHARRHLESSEHRLPPATSFPARPGYLPNEDRHAFLERCTQVWVQSLDLLNPNGQDRLTWRGAGLIADVLNLVLGHTRSHVHLPTGGGQSFSEVRSSREPGCLEFQVEGSGVYIARPKTLILERVAKAPPQSFLLLELGQLAPSGVYEPREDQDANPLSALLSRREEVVELAPGEYVERAVWDERNLGYDEEGREIPLRRGSRLVDRWFNGRMLFVTIGSLWNGTPSTYDGRHDSMSAEDIRAMIERSLPTSMAAE